MGGGGTVCLHMLRIKYVHPKYNIVMKEDNTVPNKYDSYLDY